jgi:hypothetical protein
MEMFYFTAEAPVWTSFIGELQSRMTEMVDRIRKGDFWKGEGQRVTIQQEVGAGKGRSHRASSQPFLFVFQTGNGGVSKWPQYFHVLSDQSSTHSLPQSPATESPLSTLWNPALGHGISTLLPAGNVFLLLTAHQDWREEGKRSRSGKHDFRIHPGEGCFPIVTHF